MDVDRPTAAGLSLSLLPVAPGEPIVERRCGLIGADEAKFAAAPQDVLGGARPFSLGEIADLALEEAGAEVVAEVVEAVGAIE